jgi:hypothetical protein
LSLTWRRISARGFFKKPAGFSLIPCRTLSAFHRIYAWKPQISIRRNIMKPFRFIIALLAILIFGFCYEDKGYEDDFENWD